ITSGAGNGNSYELPYLGKSCWENALASAYSGDKTLVIGTDDNITNGQVYCYIGVKTTTGTVIDKAGLSGGNLYAVAVSGMSSESSSFIPPPNTTFSLVNLGQVQSITGASLNALTVSAGATDFLRPEDGAWDPQNPADFYFNTTNAPGVPSRLWRLRFNDILNPEFGGTITAVLDGTEGQQMLDNITIDNSGHILLQEDPGGGSYLAKIWQYTIQSDALTVMAEHDASKFTSTGSSYLGADDEESSGIFDAQNILGPGMFLFVDQSHVPVANPAVVELGQILSLTNPFTANSNPEINVLGNSVNINDGSSITSFGNNTFYGPVNVGSSLTKTFVINNSGAGNLVINNIALSANPAGFSVLNPFTFPIVINPGSTLPFLVQYSPSVAGTSTATINIANTDYNESWFDFLIEGSGTLPAGILNNSGSETNILFFPNPVNQKASVVLRNCNHEELSIQIYDLQGKELVIPFDVVESGQTKSVLLNTTRLPDGIYIVKINGSAFVNTFKMVVTHQD
ncbi:MAG: choice-of-anchor D domain-containing protein, partial [Bacteroidetes bacterium]|nr:choice-of-anchor D domain-containing protein [Bacteroidota bacterium]